MDAYPALALNADMRPLSVAPLSVWTFRRVLAREMLGKIVVLERHDVEFRSSRGEVYSPPSVIMLKRYAPSPTRPRFTRMNLFARDGFRCQYCGERFRPDELTFDHVIPRSRGGGTNWENIVSACAPCNTSKGSRSDMRPLRPPREPTAREMAGLVRERDVARLHRNALDYLYWSGTLESD